MTEPNTTEPQPDTVTMERSLLRSEVEDLIRNAYREGWTESRRRPNQKCPRLEIDWTNPGGVGVREHFE